MDRTVAVVLTLVVGALVAFQPPANEQLAKHVGTLGASFLSLVISSLIVGVILVAAGGVGELRGITGYRLEHSLGPIAGAAIVTVSIITVRPLGALGVAAALVAGQLTLSVLLDRVGILGLEQIGLTPQRVFGVALLLAGTALITLR